MGKASEELKLLREQLEGRQAQQAVIEAEISRQVRWLGNSRHSGAQLAVVAAHWDRLRLGSTMCWVQLPCQ